MKKVFFCFLVVTTISLNGAQPSSSPTSSSELLTKDSSPELNHAIARLRPFHVPPSPDHVDYNQAQLETIDDGLLVQTPPLHETISDAGSSYAALRDTHAPHSAVVGHSRDISTQEFSVPISLTQPAAEYAQRLPSPIQPLPRIYTKEDKENKKSCNCCSECWQDASCRCAIGTFAAISAFLCCGAIWQLTSHQSSCSNPVTSETDVTNSCWIAWKVACNGNTDLTFEGQPFPGITQGNLLTDYIGDTLTLKGYDQSELCVQTIDCGNVNCSPNYDPTAATICWSALTACNVQPHNTTAPATGLRKRLAAKFAAKID